MVEYALHFYNNYTIVFYVLLLITVIIEGPITILTVSVLAPSLGLSFFVVYFFSFLGDLIHYFIGRFFKKNIFQNRNFLIFEKIEKKLEHHSLMDKLIVIKYTPPITSIGLIYMGFQRIDIKIFMKNIILFAVGNSIIITLIGYYFGNFLVNIHHGEYIIVGIMLAFLLVYFLLKFISSYFIKNILHDK